MLDLGMGSGQTAIAAIKSSRHYVGYEVDKSYVELSDRRVRQFIRENQEKSFRIPLPEPPGKTELQLQSKVVVKLG